MEEEGEGGVSVVLDTRVRSGGGERFEVGVRIAASVIEWSLREGRDIGLWHGSDAGTVRVRGRVEVLDALARVRRSTVPLSRVLEDGGWGVERRVETVAVLCSVERGSVESLVAACLGRPRVCLVVSPEWEAGAEERECLATLARAGVTCRVHRRGEDVGATVASLVLDSRGRG
jgi:uncharacterized protein (DUF58 family)